MRFPPPRRPTARGGRPRTVPPPPRPLPTDLDPVPFPGGAEAALEFAAFEKGLLERGSNGGGTVRNRELPNQEPSVGRQAPISEPNRDSVRWMLAGAGMAVAAVAVLLLGSGLLTAGLAAVLRAVARH